MLRTIIYNVNRTKISTCLNFSTRVNRIVVIALTYINTPIYVK